MNNLSKIKITNPNGSTDEYKLVDEDLRNRLDKFYVEIFDKIYPIGSHYITSIAQQDPNKLFTGKWQRITDAFIYAATDDDEVIPGNTRILGSNEIYLSVENLPSHSHVVRDPGHTHNIITKQANSYKSKSSGRPGFTTVEAGDGSSAPNNMYGITTDNGGSGRTLSCETTGSGQPFDIKPRHICRYIWERFG